jgi:RNA polymerase sigma factor for flagellar operon FliA
VDEPPDEQWTEYLAAPTREARDRLVVRYTPLVRVWRHRVVAGLPTTVEHADLTQSGIFGLIDAIERFDPSAARASRASPCSGSAGDPGRAARPGLGAAHRAGRVRELERRRSGSSGSSSAPRPTGRSPAEMQLPVREVQGLIRQVQVVSVEALDEISGGVAELFDRRSSPTDVRGAGAGDHAPAQRGGGRAR